MSTTPGDAFPWNTTVCATSDLRVGTEDEIITDGGDTLISDSGSKKITADKPAWMWLINVSPEHNSEPAGHPFSWDHISNFASLDGTSNNDTFVGGQTVILQLAFCPGSDDPMDQRWAGMIPNDGPEGDFKDSIANWGNYLSRYVYADLYYNDSLMTPMDTDAAYAANGDWKVNIPPYVEDTTENPTYINAGIDAPFDGTFGTVMALRYVSGNGSPGTTASTEHRPVKRWKLTLPYESFNLTLKGGLAWSHPFPFVFQLPEGWLPYRDEGKWGGESSSITYYIEPSVPPGTEVLPKFSEAFAASHTSSEFECNTQEINSTITSTIYTKRTVTDDKGVNRSVWDGQLGFRVSAGTPPGSPININNPNLVHYGEHIYIWRNSPSCFYGVISGANPDHSGYGNWINNITPAYQGDLPIPPLPDRPYSTVNMPAAHGSPWPITVLDSIGDFGTQTWDVYFVPHGTTYLELPKADWESGDKSNFSLGNFGNSGATQAHSHTHVNMKVDGGIKNGLTATLSNVGRIRKSDNKTMDPCTAVGYWVSQDSLISEPTGTVDWSDEPMQGFVSVLPHGTFGYKIFNCGGWSYFGILTSYTSISGVEYYINYDIDFSTQPNNIEWFPQANWLPVSNWGD